MISYNSTGIFQKPLMALLLAFSVVFVAAPMAHASVLVEKRGDLGIIKGIVRDEGGSRVEALGDPVLPPIEIGQFSPLECDAVVEAADPDDVHV